jgi:plastocyanin
VKNFASLLVLALVSASAYAAEAEYVLSIKNHQFSPAELKVPAGKKIKLQVHNQDSTPEEFESHDLHLEKVIAGNAKATLRVGPLQPGRYKFVGEFHEDKARGVLIAE